MKNAGYIIAKQDELPDYYKGKYVYQHILIAEQMLGRRLKKGERVHHKDLNKKNNDPSNLLVFASNRDHALCHAGSIIYMDGDVWRAYPLSVILQKKCQYCKKTFYAKNRKEFKKRKFCSTICKSKSESKLKGDDNGMKQIINDLYLMNGNFSAVSRKYNISVSAIVKRLQRRNLPYHSKDYSNASVI